MLRAYFLAMALSFIVLVMVPSAAESVIAATCYVAPILVAPGAC